MRAEIPACGGEGRFATLNFGKSRLGVVRVKGRAMRCLLWVLICASVAHARVARAPTPRRSRMRTVNPRANRHHATHRVDTSDAVAEAPSDAASGDEPLAPTPDDQLSLDPCNGDPALCTKIYDAVTYAAAHSAMAYAFPPFACPADGEKHSAVRIENGVG